MTRFDAFPPHPAADGRGPAVADRSAAAFRAAMRWGQALGGRQPLEPAMTGLADALLAEVVRLLHIRVEPRRRLALLSVDRGPVTGASVPPTNLCEPIGPLRFDNARPGAVWRLSDVIGGQLLAPDMRVRHWLETRDIAEVLFIVLSADGSDTYLVELCLRRAPAPDLLGLIQSLAPVLAEGWASRDDAVLSTLGRPGPAMARGHRGPEDPILAASNPAGLTRSEFRICARLAEGVSPRDLPMELGISTATLRSHLRSIYAKTETSGHVGLVFKLLTDRTATRAKAG